METLINLLVNIFQGITGIVAAYDEPPTAPVAPATFPFAIVYINQGEMSAMSGGLDRSIHHIYAEIHQSSEVIPQALSAVQVWPERVFAALKDDTTLATANAMVHWPLLYQAGPIEYGNFRHYGIRFTIALKVH